jgi:hypothetical protein
MQTIKFKLCTSLDNISKYDIISVEPIGEAKPEYLFGQAWGPGGYGFRNLFLPLGVVTTKEAKWYVFGGGRAYIKIRRKSGKAVCVGVKDPGGFMNRWKMLQSQLGDSVDGSQKLGDR